MADDEAQGQEDSSWSAFDAASFGEPLVWPETGVWEEPPAQAPLPSLDVAWQATGHDADTTVHPGQALAGLGGGAEVVASVDSSGAALEPLPESIWSAPGADGDIGLISTSAIPTPSVHPAAERGSEGPRWRRFDIRQGNAAMVALISLVSLVLLGMFLSVRARNQLPTDSSQSRRPSNQISVTGPLNTIPPTTTVTTTAPTATINIADLLPAADADVERTGDTTAADAGSGSGSGSSPVSPAATAAPARRTGPSGDGASTKPAAEPAAKAPAPKSPPTASAPVELDDTTTPSDASPTVNTTRPRRPTPTFNFPSFPTTADPDDDDDDDEPSYTVPSWSDDIDD